MERANVIRKKFEDMYAKTGVTQEYTEMYKKFLENKLKKLGLNGNVVRNDGVKGRILIAKHNGGRSRSPYRFNFHFLNDNGEVRKQNRCISYSCWSDDSALTSKFLKAE